MTAIVTTGAQATLRGQVVKLFRARAAEATSDRPPGTVVAIDATGLQVATGDGVVVIREIQAPGRKRLGASQFAAGRGVAVGDVLSKPELA